MEEFEIHHGASRRDFARNKAILVVEDSRYCGETLRLMALRCGARVRRANSLQAARRHFGSFRPDVVFVDMGLPDGSGTDLIEEISTWDTRPKLIAMSGALENEGKAISAGADFFVPKPVATFSTFQAMIKGSLQSVDDSKAPEPEAITLREDLQFALDALQSTQNQADHQYLGQFLNGLSATLQDKALGDIARHFLSSCDEPEAKRALTDAVFARLKEATPQAQNQKLTDLVG